MNKFNIILIIVSLIICNYVIIAMKLNTINSRKISRQQILQLQSSNVQSDDIIEATKQMTQINPSSNKIIIELSTKRKISKEETQVIAYESVYKELKDDKMVDILESPLLKVVEIMFNPLTLCLAIYFSSMSFGGVVWIQKILKIFGKGNLATKEMEEAARKKAEALEKTPFQVFECEMCGLELRPAKGRADAIFAKERFRCSRCGAKASAYFDIANMDDPRAVARAERLRLEEEELNEEDE